MDDDQSKLNADEDENREFTSRSFNDPVAKRLNKFPKLSEYTRPHFRPTERTTSSTASSTKILSSTLSSTSTTTSTTTFDTHTSSSTTPVSNTTVTNMEKREEIKTQSLITSASPKFSNNTVEIADNGDVAVNITTTTALPSITMAQIVREQNFSINEIPGQNDRIDEDLEELGEVIAHSEETTITEDTTLKSIDTGETTTSVFVSTESLINRDEEAEVLDAATKTTVHEEIIAATSHEQQQFRPRPEYRPTSVAESSASVSGQLYQDVAAKDHHEQPVLKLRGVWV